MRIYLLETCDTCRKALAALRKSGRDPEIVDIRKDGIPREKIARFHHAFGDALVNRRSKTWRDLDAASRAADPVDLIAAHPTVMKRPVIENGGELHLGWSEEIAVALR